MSLHKHGSNVTSSGTEMLLSLLIISLASIVATIEGYIAFNSGSVAVAGDAGHTIVDALGYLIPLALAARALVGTWSDEDSARRFFGFMQSALLFVVGVAVIGGAVYRMIFVHTVLAEAMLVGGVVGLIGNAMMICVASGMSKSHVTGQLLHMHVMADFGISLGVVFGGLMTYLSGSWMYEPVTAAVIGTLIIKRLAIPSTTLLIRSQA